MIKKYWNGDVKLWICFWLINLPYNIITKQIYRTNWNTALFIELFIHLLLLGISIFILIGLWRSAKRYIMENQAKAFWGYLVQILIIFGLILNVILLFN